MSNEMKRAPMAVILADGEGSRLGSLTDDCPKSLLQVGGSVILERIIRNCLSCGISQFRADDALRRASNLSGGERLRGDLACVLGGTPPPRLLILDESRPITSILTVSKLWKPRWRLMTEQYWWSATTRCFSSRSSRTGLFS